MNLKIAGANGAVVWIDGKQLNAKREAQLAAGPHTVIVKLEAKELPEALRMEASDGTFLVN